MPRKRQKLIGKRQADDDLLRCSGQVHIVPFGCDKRGSEEDGYLRLCGACQAIRRLPNSFFPPFINEIICDEDRACLYFYDYRICSHLNSCRFTRSFQRMANANRSI